MSWFENHVFFSVIVGAILTLRPSLQMCGVIAWADLSRMYALRFVRNRGRDNLAFSTAAWNSALFHFFELVGPEDLTLLIRGGLEFDRSGDVSVGAEAFLALLPLSLLLVSLCLG